ncbi:c-type cytochrome [Acidiferrobacter thiooxydans]
MNGTCKALAVTAALISLCAKPTTIAAKVAPTIITTTCSACHGAHGVSFDPRFPNLAGQGWAYLVREIRNLQDLKRADPLARSIMWPMARYVPKDAITEVARYFADQTIAPGVKQNTKLTTTGEHIYMGGIASAHLPACAACHGATGRGIPPLFPALAGQQRLYVVTQLRYFKAKQRIGPLGIMPRVAAKLSKKQMVAVAAFIRTL